LRRGLRRIKKGLGDKNSTANIREIKPGVLSRIFLLIDKKYQEINFQEDSQKTDSKDEGFYSIYQKYQNLKDFLLKISNDKSTLS